MRAQRSNRSRLTIGALIAGILLGGCGGEPALVAFDEVCTDAHRGDRVIVSGYLRLPQSLTIGRTAVIDMHARRGELGEPIKVELEVGAGPDQLRDLPPSYSPTALRVGLHNNAREVTIIDRVNVTGTLDGDGECRLTDVEVRWPK